MLICTSMPGHHLYPLGDTAWFLFVCLCVCLGFFLGGVRHKITAPMSVTGPRVETALSHLLQCAHLEGIAKIQQGERGSVKVTWWAQYTC